MRVEKGQGKGREGKGREGRRRGERSLVRHQRNCNGLLMLLLLLSLTNLKSTVWIVDVVVVLVY